MVSLHWTRVIYLWVSARLVAAALSAAHKPLSSSNVMNPKPRGLPVFLSFIITLSVIFPKFEKYAVRLSLVVSHEVPPTNSFPSLSGGPSAASPAGTNGRSATGGSAAGCSVAAFSASILFCVRCINVKYYETSGVATQPVSCHRSKTF